MYKFIDEHLPDDECDCELFSDFYKDIVGYRPTGNWTCESIKQWHDDNYIETSPGMYEPKDMSSHR